MKTAVRKLEVKDIEKLHALVIENAEGLETGLTVLDYRLLLGHATIDAVARDASGSLVLMAIGFTADEEMLLKAVEAYSWCLEYPDAIRRLYTAVELSDARPPRLIFVIERMPDAFHRKMKQLGFPDVDCIEFRLLDVAGAPAVYFERLARLRRTSITDTRPAAVSPAPVELAENVVTLGGTQRAASARLQKLLTQANVESAPRPAERNGAAAPAREVTSAPARETPQVVSMISRASAAPVVEAPPAPAIEPAPVAVAEPTVESEPAPVAVVEVAVAPQPVVELKAVEPVAVVAAEPPAPIVEKISAPVVVPVVETKAEPIAFREVVQVAEPKAAPSAQAVPEPKRVSFAEAAAKALLQQTRPGVVVPAEESRQPEPAPEPTLVGTVPGIEGLQFPGDGQLTRQWIEFLNQMAAAKK